METLNRQALPVDFMSANHFMMPSLPSKPQKTSSAGGNKGSKKAKNKQQKEGDKPKRPLSAYNLFFQHERADTPRRSHKKIGFASLACSVASKWNNIDPEARKHFDELAAADKARYKKEIEAWKASKALKQNTKDLSFSSPAPLTTAIKALPLVNCNLIATSHASQRSGSMVFSKFQNAGSIAPSLATSSARFFFQNLSGSNLSSTMRPGKASSVVGQALALLNEDHPMPNFQPLDDSTLETVKSEDSSLNSCNRSTSTDERRGSSSIPHISELAAKLDEDCLGFMSELLF